MFGSNLLLLLVIFLGFSVSSTKKLGILNKYPVEKIIPSKFYKYLDYIVKHYFKDQILLLIYWRNFSNIWSDFIRYCVSSVEVTVQICNDYQVHHTRNDKLHLADNIVILLGDVDFSNLSISTDFPTWNRTSKILIVVRDEKIVETLLVNFWTKTKAINVVVMLVEESVIKFYSLYPYQNFKIETIQFDIENTKSVPDMYPNKIPKNFNGSIIHVGATFAVPYVLKTENKTHFEEGTEVSIMETIAEHYNFQIEYKAVPEGENPWVVQTPDGKITGIFGLLHRSEVDIAYHGIRLRDDRCKIADVTVIHSFDNLAWVFPKKMKVFGWRSLFIIFDLKIWSLLLVFVIIVPVSGYLLEKYQFNGVKVSLNTHFFHALATLLGNSIGYEIKGKSFKTFTAWFLFYAVIINFAYQSCLITNLTSPKSEQAYETIRDAVEDNLIAHLYPSGKDGYNLTQHDVWNIILSPGHHVWTDDYKEGFKEMATEKKIFGLFGVNTAQFEINSNYLNENNEPVLHISKIDREPYWIGLYTPKRHPLRKFLNLKILILIEAGLVEYFNKDLNFKYKLKGEKKVSTESDGLKLSLNHLEGAFYVLFFLWAISIIIFCCEILYRKELKYKVI